MTMILARTYGAFPGAHPIQLCAIDCSGFLHGFGFSEMASKTRNNWDIQARTFVDAYESDGSYPYDYSTGESRYIAINRDVVSGRWWGGEAQVTRKIAGRHHVTAGTEWRYSYRGEQLNYDEPEYYLYMDSREKTTDIACRLEEYWSTNQPAQAVRMAAMRPSDGPPLVR